MRKSLILFILVVSAAQAEGGFFEDIKNFFNNAWNMFRCFFKGYSDESCGGVHLEPRHKGWQDLVGHPRANPRSTVGPPRKKLTTQRTTTTQKDIPVVLTERTQPTKAPSVLFVQSTTERTEPTRKDHSVPFVQSTTERNESTIPANSSSLFVQSTTERNESTTPANSSSLFVQSTTERNESTTPTNSSSRFVQSTTERTKPTTPTDHNILLNISKPSENEIPAPERNSSGYKTVVDGVVPLVSTEDELVDNKALEAEAEAENSTMSVLELTRHDELNTVQNYSSPGKNHSIFTRSTEIKRYYETNMPYKRINMTATQKTTEVASKGKHKKVPVSTTISLMKTQEVLSSRVLQKIVEDFAKNQVNQMKRTTSRPKEASLDYGYFNEYLEMSTKKVESFTTRDFQPVTTMEPRKTAIRTSKQDEITFLDSLLGKDSLRKLQEDASSNSTCSNATEENLQEITSNDLNSSTVYPETTTSFEETTRNHETNKLPPLDAEAVSAEYETATSDKERNYTTLQLQGPTNSTTLLKSIKEPDLKTAFRAVSTYHIPAKKPTIDDPSEVNYSKFLEDISTLFAGVTERDLRSTVRITVEEEENVKVLPITYRSQGFSPSLNAFFRNRSRAAKRKREDSLQRVEEDKSNGDDFNSEEKDVFKMLGGLNKRESSEELNDSINGIEKGMQDQIKHRMIKRILN